MGQRQGQSIKKLWLLIFLGIFYSGLLSSRLAQDGTSGVDGIIGVLLGLYICSHPAAGLIDLFFSGRGAQRPSSSKMSALTWFALNLLVLLIGWITIFVGTTRIVGRAD